MQNRNKGLKRLTKNEKHWSTIHFQIMWLFQQNRLNIIKQTISPKWNETDDKNYSQTNGHTQQECIESDMHTMTEQINSDLQNQQCQHVWSPRVNLLARRTSANKCNTWFAHTQHWRKWTTQIEFWKFSTLWLLISQKFTNVNEQTDHIDRCSWEGTNKSRQKNS